LGIVHWDVLQERLEREVDLDLITTAHSVNYEVDKTDGETIEVSNPSEMPDQTFVDKIHEPFVKATISAPNDYVGPVMELCQSKRGEFITMEYLDDIRVNILYYLPLSEIVFDFFDRLKSNTKGYASLNYEEAGYRESNLVKVDILIHGDQVDALSFIVHKDESEDRGRKIVKKLKEVIPRQQFEIPVQAAIGNHVIARSTVRAFRKDVTEKLYGGDVTRRMKLLEQQKEAKKRMKSVGNVDVPQDACMAVFNLDEDQSKK